MDLKEIVLKELVDIRLIRPLMNTFISGCFFMVLVSAICIIFASKIMQ